MLNFLFLTFLLLFSSCSSSKPEDFREDGRSISKSILKQLKKVQSKEDLIEMSSVLEDLFTNLTSIMINAKNCSEEYCLEIMPLEQEDYLISDKFRFELNRIYRIPGAKEIMEKIQEKPLKLLDLSEQQRQKRKTKIPFGL